MLPQPARRNVRRAGSLLAVLAGLSVTLSSSSCDKVPLLAPTGSVITLFATAATVPSNGSMEIVATVIEQGTASTTTPVPANGGTGTGTTATSTPGAGTPVHNGTVVTFTTTIGRIEPSEARTDNGQVRVRFHADGQSGTAVVTAFSGGASGKLENLKVGSAGGRAHPLECEPSGAGLLGRQQSSLRTRGRRQRRRAPAGPGGLHHHEGTTHAVDRHDRRERSGKHDALDEPGSDRDSERCRQDRHRDRDHQPDGPASASRRQRATISAGTPTSFTVTVAATANISNVTLDFGDGTITESRANQRFHNGAAHLSGRRNVHRHGHRESTPPGAPRTVSTAVTILPGQPPAVTSPRSDTTPAVGQSVTFTATVTGEHVDDRSLRLELRLGRSSAPRARRAIASRRSTRRWDLRRTGHSDSSQRSAGRRPGVGS